MKNIPLYQKIFEHYYENIVTGQVKEGEQIHTEREIMEIFYVSRITAKAAIDMLAERGLVERIPGRGTFVTKTPLLKQKTEGGHKIIGLVLCDIDQSFGFEVLKGIEEEASKRNIHLLFKRTFEDINEELNAIKTMVEIDTSGIIIQTVHGETYNDEILKLYLNGFPFVLIDRHMDKTKVPFVTTNNYKASAEMVKYLRKLGYKNISFMSAPNHTSTLDLRYRGFREIDYGAKNLDLVTLKSPEVREKDEELIKKDYEAIKDHLIKNPQIDAIFAAEYFVAKLARKVVEDMGMKIPEDIGIVCFDNDVANDNGEPFFTHIKQPQYEMGRLAVEKMDKIIQGEEIDDLESFIDGVIIEGRSVKNKNKK